jgi:hypothetical protein
LRFVFAPARSVPAEPLIPLRHIPEILGVLVGKIEGNSFFGEGRRVDALRVAACCAILLVRARRARLIVRRRLDEGVILLAAVRFEEVIGVALLRALRPQLSQVDQLHALGDVVQVGCHVKHMIAAGETWPTVGMKQQLAGLRVCRLRVVVSKYDDLCASEVFVVVRFPTARATR